tara:strand:+ start:251 stop:679 length:429 start_codon:yes stop_codon:yes gene_type:complete
MIDPISVAVAFSAVKKAVSISKDLREVGGELKTLFGFLDGVEEAKKSKNSNDPLNTYINQVTAKRYENELRVVIQSTQGQSGWIQFQKIRESYRKEQKKSQYAKLQKKEDITNILTIIFGVLILAFLATVITYFALKYSNKV